MKEILYGGPISSLESFNILQGHVKNFFKECDIKCEGGIIARWGDDEIIIEPEHEYQITEVSSKFNSEIKSSGFKSCIIGLENSIMNYHIFEKRRE